MGKKEASATNVYSRSSLMRKRSDPSLEDKNEDVDDIVFQMICKSVVLQLYVVFLI